MHCAELWSLCKSDFVKGLVMSVLAVVMDFLYQVFVIKKSLDIDWRELGVVAAGAAVIYLMKQFGTGKNGRMLTDAPPKTK